MQTTDSTINILTFNVVPNREFMESILNTVHSDKLVSSSWMLLTQSRTWHCLLYFFLSFLVILDFFSFFYAITFWFNLTFFIVFFRLSLSIVHFVVVTLDIWWMLKYGSSLTLFIWTSNFLIDGYHSYLLFILISLLYSLHLLPIPSSSNPN